MRLIRSPLAGTHDADVCVVGGGMTGCAAALELARRKLRVAVVEARTVGAGASGANLGHVAVGLGSHYAPAIAQLGAEGALEVWETHRENHARLKELLAELKVPCGYEARGGFALALDRKEAVGLAESEDLLRADAFSGEFFDHYMLEARFDVRGFAGAYWSADDGEIDSAPFVAALAEAAEAAGARIFEGSPVRAMSRGPRGVTVETAAGSVEAGVAIVALDAYAPSLVPFLAERIRPLRGQCLSIATEIPLNIPSPAYAGHGRVYWRAAGDRLSIGGFDDLALAEESTAEPGTTPVIQKAIEAFAREHFLAAVANVTARWSGIMGISLDGFPFVGPIPGEPLVAAAGFTGLGFSYALLAARWAAEFATTGNDPTPARYRAARPFTPGPWPPRAPRS
jgi:gamma-glutamylputrescine oxidase